VIVRVPTDRLRYSKSAWPREALNTDRISLFWSLMTAGESVPPIEVIAQGDGTYLISDGVHRSHAARAGKFSEVEVLVVEPEVGESAYDCAFRRGLETATRSSLPLTRAERRRAALRLLQTRQEMSHRAIAQLVGVAHSSVDRWAQEEADSAGTDGSNETPPPRPSPSADETARRLVGFLIRLDESRGLLDYLAPARMGRHLAAAFADRFGDDAPSQAERLAQWTGAAADLLRERAR